MITGLKAEVIKAWADGAQIEVYAFGKWADPATPHFDYAPGEHRVKPEPVKVRYWLALFRNEGGWHTASCNDPHCAYRWAAESTFIRWLHEGVEVEV